MSLLSYQQQQQQQKKTCLSWHKPFDSRKESKLLRIPFYSGGKLVYDEGHSWESSLDREEESIVRLSNKI